MKIKRAYFITLIMLFFLCNILSAQSSWSEWKKGSIFLENGDSITGNIIYEEGLEILQFSDNTKAKVNTYGAFLVKGFELYYSKFTKNYERFYWNKGVAHHKKYPDFFINIYDGRIKLLSKERKILVSDDFPVADFSFINNNEKSNFPIFYEETVFNYYLMVDDKIEYVRDFDKYFKTKFPTYKNEIKSINKNSPNNEIERVKNVIKFLENKIY